MKILVILALPDRKSYWQKAGNTW